MDGLVVFLVFFFLFLMSLAIHEVAHAAVAAWCGDPTARDRGRLTLNPLAHVDPLWTLVMPIICLVVLGFPFGGARPVPVNPLNFRHPRRDDRLVTLAGPAANLLQAGAYALLFHLFCGGTPDEIAGQALPAVLGGLVFVNLLLALFNLVPVPPLDGSHVVASFLPERLAAAYRRVDVFGILLLLVLLRFDGLSGALLAAISTGFDALGLNLETTWPAIQALMDVPRQLGL